jgi:hypothetical protein
MSENKEEYDSYPSLYDAFNLGDRVKRIYTDKSGKKMVYKGIVLAIDKDCLEIYWDTRDGKYRPNGMDIAFTNCQKYEIFNGTDYYSPVEKDKKI